MSEVTYRKREREEDNEEPLIQLREEPTVKKLHEIEEPNESNSCVIKLGKTGKRVTFVSKEDFEHLNQFKWTYCDGYVSTTTSTNGKSWRMNIYIMQVLHGHNTEGMFVDHVRGNTLDHRYEMLRVLTPAENAQNKKNREGRFNGVRFDKKAGKWVAALGKDMGNIHLGSYDVQEKAIEARDVYLYHLSKTEKHYYNLAYPERADIYNNMTPYKKPEKIHSKYFGVSALRSVFIAQINYGGRKVRLLDSDDEIACARAVDAFVIEKKMDRKLNFPDEHPDYIPPPTLKK